MELFTLRTLERISEDSENFPNVYISTMNTSFTYTENSLPCYFRLFFGVRIV